MKKIEPVIITLTCIAVTASVAFAETLAPSPITDPILNYLQAAGFPAWAGVVAWGVVHITNEMRSFTQRLDAHIAQTNERLFAIEEMVMNKQNRI